MAFCEHQPPRIARSKRAGIVVLVLLLHLLLLYLMALSRGVSLPQPPPFPAIDVVLFRPGGGGSPATAQTAAARTDDVRSPSASVHVPTKVLPWPETLDAPPEPAEPNLLVGAGSSLVFAPSPTETVDASAAPATGASAGTGGAGGGVGGGVGTGVGSGSGPGRGGNGGVVLIRAPAGASISRDVSPAALAALPGAYGVLRCQIRLNQRLDRCQILREYPQGAGKIALERSKEFRFRPPTRIGRFRDRHRITVAVAFPAEALNVGEPPSVDGN